MRIGVDFDETIADVTAMRIWYLKTNHGLDVTSSQLFDRSVLDLKKILSDPDFERYANFYPNEGTLLAPEVANASNVIRKLVAEGHKIVVITGRKGSQFKYAGDFLKQRKIPYHHLIYVDVHGKVDPDPKASLLRRTEGFERKKVVVDKLQIECMVDDMPGFLLPLSGSGILLCLLNKPWNLNENLPSDIIRVNDWNEVYTLIQARSLQSTSSS